MHFIIYKIMEMVTSFESQVFKYCTYCPYTCEVLQDSSESAVLSSVFGIEAVLEKHLSLQSLSITEKRAGSLKSLNIYAFINPFWQKKLLVPDNFNLYTFNWQKNVPVKFQNNPVSIHTQEISFSIIYLSRVALHWTVIPPNT